MDKVHTATRGRGALVIDAGSITALDPQTSRTVSAACEMLADELFAIDGLGHFSLRYKRNRTMGGQRVMRAIAATNRIIKLCVKPKGPGTACEYELLTPPSADPDAIFQRLRARFGQTDITDFEDDRNFAPVPTPAASPAPTAPFSALQAFAAVQNAASRAQAREQSRTAQQQRIEPLRVRMTVLNSELDELRTQISTIEDAILAIDAEGEQDTESREALQLLQNLQKFIPQQPVSDQRQP
jgi:hypothetical protein